MSFKSHVKNIKISVKDPNFYKIVLEDLRYSMSQLVQTQSSQRDKFVDKENKQTKQLENRWTTLHYLPIFISFMQEVTQVNRP